MPEDVPIKIKIKKEKELIFKDMKSEKWVRELELEVTNTGDRPIYYLDLLLVSDVTIGGSHFVFPLAYGRDALGNIISKATSEDIPIKPGETLVFKIHPGQISAWEKDVRGGKHADAGSLQIKLETLSFGDGTGLFGNSGTPYPLARREQSSVNKGEALPKKLDLSPRPPVSTYLIRC